LIWLKIRNEKFQKPNNYIKYNLKSKEIIKIFIRSCYFTKIILFIKYSFIYSRFNLRLVKEQLLAIDEIALDTSSALLSPILLRLKIRLELIQKQIHIF
jgi:hypothetical protein